MCIRDSQIPDRAVERAFAARLDFLDVGRQADPIQQGDERLRIEFLDVHHRLRVPDALRDQHGRRDRRDAGGVADALRLDFLVAPLVVGDLVDQHLSRLPVLPALDEVADAGFAGIARREGLRVGQQRLDHFQRHHVLTRGQRHRQMRQKAQGAQHGKDVDVMLSLIHI